MTDPPKETKAGTLTQAIGKRINQWFNNRLNDIWASTFGKREGVMVDITKESTDQINPLLENYKYLFTKNDKKIEVLQEIEANWTEIEEKLFGAEGFEYKEKPGDHVFTDRYRLIEYFKEGKAAKLEASIFKETGTIEITKKSAMTEEEILEIIREAEQTKNRIEGKIAREGSLKKDDPDIANLEIAQKILEEKESLVGSLGFLPHIDTNPVVVPFTDGRPQSIVAIGASKMEKVSTQFEIILARADHFASSSGMGANIRTPVTQLLTTLRESFKEIKEIELNHGEKLDTISTIIEILKGEAGKGLADEFKPKEMFIRFAHTYKIIKPHIIKKVDGPDGKKIQKAVYFKDEYSDFKRDDEIEAGKDENNWPLEVFEYNGGWYVLTDRWWAEISRNKWQERMIRIVKEKDGGEEVWNNKVTKGINVKGKYGEKYLKKYIRKVPDEWVHDGGIGDVEPLDKISFISNETDAYRDDFRDGRFHPHSKSSMDYIIAGLFRINSTQSMDAFDKIDTKDLKTRIMFRPIYYTEADFDNWEDENAKKKIGTVYDGKIVGCGNPSKITPEDEQKISRKYDMETEEKTLRDEIRTPTHLNPAFDRAAVNHDYIHWGRMLYYETTDGINKWSENPFPHISTRGLAKFLIDFTMRNNFSFEKARNALKREPGWDYGIRHYGGPFITDPLGPGGVLEHAKYQIAKKGGSKKGGHG